MSKPKKVTYKELMDKLDFVFYKTAEIQRAVDYTHTLLLEYISFKKDNNALKEHLATIQKEMKDEQANRDSSGSDSLNKSGDKKSNGKSDKSGRSSTKKGSKDKT